jgi:hypothetical protein
VPDKGKSWQEPEGELTKRKSPAVRSELFQCRQGGTSDSTDLTELPDADLISSWAFARTRACLNPGDLMARGEYIALRDECRRRMSGAES